VHVDFEIFENLWSQERHFRQDGQLRPMVEAILIFPAAESL
jgi:hypothetical protein